MAVAYEHHRFARRLFLVFASPDFSKTKQKKFVGIFGRVDAPSSTLPCWLLRVFFLELAAFPCASRTEEQSNRLRLRKLCGQACPAGSVVCIVHDCAEYGTLE